MKQIYSFRQIIVFCIYLHFIVEFLLIWVPKSGLVMLAPLQIEEENRASQAGDVFVCLYLDERNRWVGGVCFSPVFLFLHKGLE